MPFIYTFVPIWRERGRGELGAGRRLLLRLALMVVIFVQILFTLEELMPGTFMLEVLRWSRTLVWVGLGAGAVIGWLTHPEGLRGL